MKLTFATYNIHKGVGTDRRFDPDRIVAVLREIDADVIALQEADRRFGDRAAILSRVALDDSKWRPAPLSGRPRSMGWHGNAMLVRRDIEIVEARSLPLPTLEPRGAICCDLKAEGRLMRVVGAHLDLSGLRRRDQVRAILTFLDECDRNCPSVVMGDFNQWGTATGAMREFADEWQMLHCGPSFPSRSPIAKLDRIIASDEWASTNCRVHHSALATRASDHLPIVAEMELLKE